MKRDGGKDGEGEGKASARGEVVVLRSVRMSAFPLSGEGDHRLSMSVTPLVYASLRGRGKGCRVIGVYVCCWGGSYENGGNLEKECNALFIIEFVTLPFISLFFVLYHPFFLFTVPSLLPCCSVPNAGSAVLPACVLAYCLVFLTTYTLISCCLV